MTVVMRTVDIRKLKAHLSGYLRDVERGDVILVTDRGRAVAEMRPAGAAGQAFAPADVRYRKLVADGRLRPASLPASVDWPARSLKRGTSGELLDAERGG